MKTTKKIIVCSLLITTILPTLSFAEVQTQKKGNGNSISRPFLGLQTENTIDKSEKNKNDDKKIAQVQNLLENGAGNSGKVPPGLLRAPGILKKLTTNGTTTKDTASPTILQITASEVSATGATISFKTNEPTTAKIFASTNSEFVTSSSTQVASTNALRLDHSFVLTGLTASTTYFYRIQATDAAKNTSTSTENTFRTAGGTSTDETLPTIVGPFSFAVTQGSARIVFVTSEATDGVIYYGTTTPITIASTTPVVHSSGFTFLHNLQLTGLNLGTNYYYLVKATDAAGNSATTTEGSFMTLESPDVTAPTVSNLVATSTAATSSVIKWTTNEPATSAVFYSSTTPVLVGTSTHSVTSALLDQSHAISLTGLTPGTKYYFFVESTDTFTNTTKSPEAEFTTPSL